MKTKILFICCLFFATLNATTIQTDKALYDHGNGDTTIHVSFGEMEGTDTDWVGIYPAGASYEFENVLAWKLTDSEINGSMDFNLLSAGNYDVRAFFNNSLTKQAEYSFEIVGIAPVAPDVNLTTDKISYLETETITVAFSEMQGNETDWIGIYPAESSYEFVNVLDWVSTNGDINGTVTFESLAIGSYEARAFFNNSLTKEATSSFVVVNDPNHHDVNLTTVKSTYLNTESIAVNFQYMQGNESDWIGIYPAGASYEFENVITYKQTAGDINGSVNFSNLPVGSYDVRAFFNNTLTQQASILVNVIADPNYHDVNVTLNKNLYAQNELIHVAYNYMQGNSTDWIGIYPAGASYEFENVIDWKYTNGSASGELSLNGLDAGEYEVRAFFNNSLSQKAVKSFTVSNLAPTTTLYEDAENGTNPNWVHVSGQYPLSRITPGFNSIGAIRFRAYWTQGGTYNPTEFKLPLNGGNTTEKVLEIDMRARSNPHFNFSLLVQTKDGRRLVVWDSFYNHNGVGRTVIEPFISHSNGNTILNNPAPDDYHYFGNRNVFRHYKINVEKTIRHLEPDNELISIDAFIVTGGEYDNIKLSSH